MTKIFLIIFVVIFAGICLDCDAIKVLDNLTKEIVNNGVKKQLQAKTNGNSLTSKGPVIYSDDESYDDSENINYTNGMDVKSDTKIEQSSRNDDVWVANNKSISGQNQQKTSSPNVSITSPDVIRIVGKDNRGKNDIKDFVPSPELKIPLTEDILHQNYMNDHTKLQIQAPENPTSFFQPVQGFQPTTPYKNTLKETTTAIPLTTAKFRSNSQQESYRSKYQTNKPVQSGSTDLSNSEKSTDSKDQQNTNDIPIYQKSGSTKQYYPTMLESKDESENSKSIGDSYQPFGNQYVRNEVAWPIKDKDYIRVQPQTVQEYAGSGNWNNKDNNHEVLQKNFPYVQSPYQIYEDEQKNEEFKNNNHNQQYHQKYNPINVDHHSNAQHGVIQNVGYQSQYTSQANIPTALGQFKENSHQSNHPYKFESISQQSNLNWGEGNVENHGPFQNGRHPIFGYNPVLPVHMPKHYETDIITSNEDGTISLKGTNYHGSSQYENNEHYVEDGNYHHSSLEHSHDNKASKYLYFKKIASVIAGIIPIGLLISALTPNYVVISPNATTLNSPVAPFTLVQGSPNRLRSLKPDRKNLKNPAIDVEPSTISNPEFITVTTLKPTVNTNLNLRKEKENYKTNFLKLSKKYSMRPFTNKVKKSNCIERSICELAAGNKNPQLLKQLLEELQRNFRNEIQQNGSSLTLDKAATYKPLASALASTELYETSSLIINKTSLITEDELLRASRGVNCSYYECEKFTSKL